MPVNKTRCRRQLFIIFLFIYCLKKFHFLSVFEKRATMMQFLAGASVATTCVYFPGASLTTAESYFISVLPNEFACND